MVIIVACADDGFAFNCFQNCSLFVFFNFLLLPILGPSCLRERWFINILNKLIDMQYAFTKTLVFSLKGDILLAVICQMPVGQIVKSRSEAR